MSTKNLIVIVGPTAVGKTSVAVNLAVHLKTDIINADSRQIFREMKIGTAVPSDSDQELAKHHFISCCSIHESYNASRFEQDVNGFLEKWFEQNQTIVMAGGSGMYVDAVCHGIDDLPTIDGDVRKNSHQFFKDYGLEGLRQKLLLIDPQYYSKVDRNNPQRMMKALEVFEMTGKTYTSFLTGRSKKRDFNIIKIGLNIPRYELHENINRRVDQMINDGLIEEARGLMEFRNLNALNTVGYKELFSYFEGNITLLEAIDKIKSHTRQYARRQVTWFRRDQSIHWFHPSEFSSMLAFIESHIS